MTAKVSLTESWQITIPPEVRHKLGIQAGDELVFIVSGDQVEKYLTNKSFELS